MHHIRGFEPLFYCLFHLACRLCHLDCQRGVISCHQTLCIELYLVQSTVSAYILPFILILHLTSLILYIFNSCSSNLAIIVEYLDISTIPVQVIWWMLHSNLTFTGWWNKVESPKRFATWVKRAAQKAADRQQAREDRTLHSPPIFVLIFLLTLLIATKNSVNMNFVSPGFHRINV